MNASKRKAIGNHTRQAPAAASRNAARWVIYEMRVGAKDASRITAAASKAGTRKRMVTLGSTMLIIKARKAHINQVPAPRPRVPERLKKAVATIPAQSNASTHNANRVGRGYPYPGCGVPETHFITRVKPSPNKTVSTMEDSPASIPQRTAGILNCFFAMPHTTTRRRASTAKTASGKVHIAGQCSKAKPSRSI